MNMKGENKMVGFVLNGSSAYDVFRILERHGYGVSMGTTEKSGTYLVNVDVENTNNERVEVLPFNDEDVEM